MTGCIADTGTFRALQPPPRGSGPPLGANLLAAGRRPGRHDLRGDDQPCASQTGRHQPGPGFPGRGRPGRKSSTPPRPPSPRAPTSTHPAKGIPQLRDAVAAHQERFYGLTPDPDTEVIVTTGATEAIAASLLAFAGPGDEVLTFEPFYDSYGAVIGLSRRHACHRAAARARISCRTSPPLRPRSATAPRWCC